MVCERSKTEYSYYVLSSWFVSLSTSTTEETETERAEGEERKRMGDGRQDAVESK